MTATSRELVYQTLAFENQARAPRQLWTLPWATTRYPEELRRIDAEFPPDISGVSGHLRAQPPTSGSPYEIGESIDAWGSRFRNIQAGVHGEVCEPLVRDWETDVDRIHFPREWLTVDVDAVNRDCDASDKFVFADCLARPFEQMQFLRGSQALYLDLLQQPPAMMQCLADMHRLYCETFELWCRTRVDAVMFMDDWGSQQSLLIPPALWRDLFKPLYRDYVQIAHSHGKKIFMHSDGHILAIIPDLIEIGLDALNSQLFCMGLDKLAPFAGRMTFWGEIDRQHLLPHGTPEDIRAAVQEVHRLLWRDGGCIAQCEFGAGARPENVYQVFKSWDEVTSLPGVVHA